MNAQELFEKYAKLYVTHADLPLVNLENFTQAIAEIISHSLEAEVKPACETCNHFTEYDTMDINEHGYHIKFCNKHNYGMSMWNTKEVACTEYMSKSV